MRDASPTTTTRSPVGRERGLTLFARRAATFLLVAAFPLPAQTPARPPFQAISFLGDTLRELPLAAATRARYEQQLAEARTAYEHSPTNLDSIVWYGRRLGYLGRLRESIEIYTRGLAIHPDNPWLLRHRGHRYISVRELDRAIADLERATRV